MLDLNAIAKSFTRYFIPGLSFTVFGILIPLSIVSLDFVVGILKEGQGFLLLTALLIGYLLDSIKGYRWTPSIRAYNKQKKELSEILSSIEGIVSSNPDELVSNLWLKEKETYERIFYERAEWVMILETSSAMLLSAILSTLALLCPNSSSPYFWALPPILLFLSVLAARNGIDRMKAHDSKLVYAVKVTHNQNTEPVEIAN